MRLAMVFIYFALAWHSLPAHADTSKIVTEISGLEGRETLKIAFGSCISGQDQSIWSAILAERPDLMIFLGDNVYLGEAEFGNATAIYNRYKGQFSSPSVRRLLSSIPTFSIWSDHDFGPDNSDSSFAHSKASRDAFDRFWRSSKLPGTSPGLGIAHSIRIGELLILLTDDRTYRLNPASGRAGVLFGQEQLDWIQRQLSAPGLKAAVIASAGQILNGGRSGESASLFPAEREKVLDVLSMSPITPVILSGDKHYLQILERKHSGKRLLEFTSSPLTAWPAGKGARAEEPFSTATIYSQHNFGLLTIKLGSPVRYSIKFLDKNGGELLSRRY
ncbi:MAG: alkaline phosphatase family protein [Deltaproteobacteria bacterium]|nr:alkaline phosphatase family protein [Deltaproteobacteria bacterium]